MGGMMEKTSLPHWGPARDDTLANVTWPIAQAMSPQDVLAAKAALVIHMRKKHPGKKYRVLRQWDNETDGLIAVPLNG
jgi:uncharacterized short protein YbdD (DUF466 family)